MSARVGAVIVTFNPDLDRLRLLVDRLRDQCGAIVVVDNASSSDRRPNLRRLGGEGALTLVENDSNKGLGSALNAGVSLLRRLGATHFLFFDQDSIPEADMVGSLIGALKQHAEGSVAAVGPEWRDPRTKQQSAASGDSGEVAFLITSGMLVPREAFSRVGAFDEGLFVDSTDREWCFRARSMGYRLLSVPGARLAHELGDRPVRFFGRVVHGWAHHNPQRLYYMMRNRVLLYKRGYVPIGWKCYDAVRAVGKLFAFSVLIRPRVSNARWMLAGLWDGLRGKTGPLF